MKSLSFLVIIATIFISSSGYTQTRSFHAQELVLDNGNNTKTSTLFYAGASAQTLDLTKISTNNDSLLLGLNLDLQNNNITNGGNAFLASVTASGNINTTAGVIQTKGVTRIDSLGNGTFGTVAATGNINSSGGTLQTNGATRIDNSGNGTFTNLSSKGMISANVTTMFIPFYNVGTTEYLIVNESFFPFPQVILPLSTSSKGRILIIENPNNFPFNLNIFPQSGDNINFAGANVAYNLGIGSSVTLMSDGLGNWIKTN